MANGMESGFSLGSESLRNSLALMMSAGLLLAVAAGASCGRRLSAEGCVEWASEVASLDIRELDLSPWSIMHLMLVVGRDGALHFDRMEETCSELLQDSAVRGGPLLVEEKTLGFITRKRKQFSYELEDHYAQYLAIVAQSMTDFGAGTGAWDDLARAFLLLCDRREALDELEWLAILGGCCVTRVEEQSLHDRVIVSGAKVVESLLVLRYEENRQLACGAMHASVGFTIWARSGVLPAVLQARTENLLSVLHGIVDARIDARGYVPLPGIHYDFEEPNFLDDLRVLGHLAEWYSYGDVSLPPRAREVLQKAIRKSFVLFSAGRLHDKEVGDLCHAVAAIVRMKDRGV